MTIKIFFLLLFFLKTSPTQGEYIVSAKTKKSEVGLDETFNLQIEIEYKGKQPTEEDISLPGPSQLKNFYVLSRESGFQNIVNIINGKTESIKKLTYTYFLQPKTKGVFRLKNLKVKIFEKPYGINPVEIKVTDKPAPSAPSSPSSPTFPSPFSSPFLSPHNIFKDFFDSPPLRRSKRDIKFKLQLKKSSYYVGEMIRAKWVIFLSSTTGGPQIFSRKLPDFKGFLQVELGSNTQLQPTGTEVLKNVLYRKLLLDDRALFPIKTGILEIGPYQIRISDYRFFGGGERIKSTLPQTITVKPLPERKEKDFSGGVGVFKGEAWLDQKETPLNRPITFRLRISGKGHPHLIRLPEISFPSSLQVYPPVEHAEFSAQGESYKEFEILLIPKALGNLQIPGFQFTTFDPYRETYITHTIPSLPLKVLPEEPQTEAENEKFFTKAKPSQKTSALTKKSGKWLLSHKQLTHFWIWFYSAIFLLFLSVCFMPLLFKKKVSLKKKILFQLKEIKKSVREGHFEESSLRLLKLLDETLSLLPKTSEDKQPSATLPPILREKHGALLKAIQEKLEATAYSQNKNYQTKEKMESLMNQTDELIKQLLHSI